MGTPLCNTLADCPVPAGGSAQVICRSLLDIVANGFGGVCVLTCEIGAQCPDGMECFQERWCPWGKDCVQGRCVVPATTHCQRIDPNTPLWRSLCGP